MNAEGRLRFEIGWDGAQVSRVAVRSSRPLVAGRLLAGRTGPEAVALLPKLYAICGHAQEAAGQQALASAESRETPKPELRRREQRVLLETIEEYLFRLLVDLPGVLGRPGEAAALARVCRHLRRVSPAGATRESIAGLADEIEAVVAVKVLDMAVEEWIAIDRADSFRAWIDQRASACVEVLRQLCGATWDRTAAGLMPMPDRDAVLKFLAPAMESDPQFAHEPAWRGEVLETGALARQQDHGLMRAAAAAGASRVALRLLARIVELTHLTERLREDDDCASTHPWVQGAAVRPGVGVAWVQNARGLLLHWLEKAGERIARYVIVAPTEWNFHPRGAFVTGLSGMPVRDEGDLRYRAEVLARSLDPCVGYEIEVQRA
jgi:hypothetical protein